MEQQFVVERDCSALGGLFQIIINDMKSGNGNWDDFVVKANKFHSQLKASIAASTAFLDAFQKIADMATSTRGGTKEIGTALTRLCLRHRSVEARLKTFTSSIMDCLILPLQDRIEEWKKTCGQLDKEHSKEYKRLRQELKKKQSLDSNNAIYANTSNTLRFKKHVRNKLKSDSNNWNSLHSMSRSMDSMEANEKLFIFEEMEKKAVRRALIEERSHFCLFVNFMRPVVEEELAMIQEVTHLQEILDALCKMTADPYSLPSSSELVISDLRLSTSETAAFSLQTPPSSPSSFGSRKSSMCSISSFNSSSSGSTHSPSHHCRYRSLSQPSVGPGPVFRHTSISSQDSGFMSQDYNFIHYAQLPLCASAKYVNQFKNNEVSSLSEQSSGSTSSTSSIPASNKRMDATIRSHSINTYDTNRSHSKTRDSYALNNDNTSEENVVSIVNTHSNHNCNDSEIKTQTNQNCTEKPELPSREVAKEKPSIPAKPNTLTYDSNQCQTTTDSALYCESHPIYANSSELMNDESNVACSEGSITPTNPERSNSPCSEMYKYSNLSSSTLAIARPSKPAPPPPVRRTSTLSNPNAITLGTLKSAGVNTYEEIQNLTKSYATYEDINNLTLSLQNLSSSEPTKQHIYSRTSDAVIYSNTSQMALNYSSNSNKNSEYESAKSLFESAPIRDSKHTQPVHVPEEQSTALPLPAPPPEAFSDSEASHGHPHYNKITNVHRQFLETLNSKLGQFRPESHISPRLAKRRSVSLTHNRDNSDDWNSDGALPNRHSSQSPSIQQTLMAFMTGAHSRSPSSSTSSSRHRRQSPESSRKKAAFTLASCDRQSLMASLNMRLAQRQQTEIAKAAAQTAQTVLHRKQSVPDITDHQNHLQSQQCFSSSALNLANASQPVNPYHSVIQPIQQYSQPQQVAQLQSQPQQQIYGPVLHQQQLQRRSSQPTMGIKIINTTSRQPTYDTPSDRQSLKPFVANKAGVGQTAHYQQQQQQHSSQSYSTDLYANSRPALPSESNNKSIYSSTQIQIKFDEMAKPVNRLPMYSMEPTVDSSAVTARVNSWFNSVQLPKEVKLCRESLMDQIRRGKQLRKVSASNDRSAPKLARI